MDSEHIKQEQALMISQEDFMREVDLLCALEPRFRAVLDQWGIPPIRLRPKGPEALVRIICAQQLSKSSAEAISKRVLAKWPELSLATIAQDPEASLDGLGLSRAKKLALGDLAKHILDDQLMLEQLVFWPVDKAIAHLTKIRGIGPWSAQLYLMFSLNHSDIFAPGDLALQRGADHLFGWSTPCNEVSLAEIAKSWAPHRSAAAHLLWHHYGHAVRPTSKN